MLGDKGKHIVTDTHTYHTAAELSRYELAAFTSTRELTRWHIIETRAETSTYPTRGAEAPFAALAGGAGTAAVAPLMFCA